ncbi:MAG: cation:proton antiporter, partial [Tepidisphaeraceae bacterium]
MHDMPLITTMAVTFTAAWVLGLITQKLRLSPIVGYLLAGVAIGPYTPGFVGDAALVPQLAEIGVILLMFGVGLHFHLGDLLAVRTVAVPGAIGQSLVATLLGVVVAVAFGWSAKAGLVLGMATAVASTVVLIRGLTDNKILDTTHGHVAVGWLIVEDIFTVILLVLIPALGTGAVQDAAPDPGPLWLTLLIALAKLGALVVLLLLAGSKLIPWVMVQVARLRSRELFTLTVLVMAIAIAAGSSYVFGASMALGAFLAGMVVGQSAVSHQAAADALPLRDAFAVLFFASVGMLFDPTFVVREPGLVLAGLGIVMIGKPLAALVIVAVIGYPLRTGLTVALGLAQIGEFSFILSEVSRHHGLMNDAGHNVIVACAIVSISINPFLFRVIPSLEAAIKRRPVLWRLLNRRASRREGQLNAKAVEVIERSDEPLAV